MSFLESIECNSCKSVPDFRYMIIAKTGIDATSEMSFIILSVPKIASSICQSKRNASKFAKIIRVIVKSIFHIKKS